MISRILLDMDEVLVDFVGGALAIHGWTREQFEAKRPREHWDMTGPMDLTNKQFWAPIHDAGEKFWIDLQPLPWAKELLSLVSAVSTESFIVTTPFGNAASYSGKAKWLTNYFGEGFNQWIPTWHKRLLAMPGAVLIDDREQNVLDFREAGGDGIIFPSLGNTLCDYADDPVGYLKKFFDKRESRPDPLLHYRSED